MLERTHATVKTHLKAATGEFRNISSNSKYKAYHDRKAKAAPLTTTDYCYILNPKADTQATKIPFREFRWIGPYKVEKGLPNNNYIVRRLGTNKTQLLHRIRLRKFIPSAPLADNFVRETDWQKDDNIKVTHDDLYAHTWSTNFGTDPFDTELPDNEQDDIQDYVSIIPPTLPRNFKKQWGSPGRTNYRS